MLYMLHPAGQHVVCVASCRSTCCMCCILQVGSQKYVDVQSTYFVLNPQGDLKKTEKLFGERFSGEEGWEGVIGKAPPTDQLTAALQEKELYMCVP